VLVSAPAIVVYFVLPTAWAALAGALHFLRHAAVWLDSSKSLEPLTTHPLSAMRGGTRLRHARGVDGAAAGDRVVADPPPGCRMRRGARRSCG